MSAKSKNSRYSMSHEDWTEKYRPDDLSQVVGNKEARRELKNWGSKWVSGKPSKKAVILAGKPGIGKTSSALALANTMGWEAIEMNASDQRNKESIKKFVGRSAVDDTFSESGGFTPYKEGKRTLLIIDEADNIFGSEDRGGISEVKSTIKKTEQPVILIANDYYDLTSRSDELKSLCKKIDFEPVEKRDIIVLLRDICKEENIECRRQVLDSIADNSEGDVRSAIRDLESVASGKNKITQEDLSVLGSRNKEAEIFPTLKKILQNRNPLQARKSVRYLNEEPTDLITWIDENLPREYEDSMELYSGYEWLARADVYLGRVRSRQNYRLWNYASDLMTAGVSSAKNHRHEGWTKYAFPTWIRKMSRSKSERSMKRRISEKIAPKIHSTTEKIRSEFFPYFVYFFREDREYREEFVEEVDLEPNEVAYLLNVKKSSKKVQSLFTDEEDEIERKEQSSDDEKEEEQDENEGQSSLLEF